MFASYMGCLHVTGRLAFTKHIPSMTAGYTSFLSNLKLYCLCSACRDGHPRGVLLVHLDLQETKVLI